jgi:hypothetical protein
MDTNQDFSGSQEVVPAPANPALKNLLKLTVRRERAADWRRVVLESLRHDERVSVAAARAGVSKEIVYRTMRRSARFRAAVLRAQKLAQRARLEEVESEIYRRAVKGTTKPLVVNGEIVGYQRVYSDRLALRLAERLNRKAWAPQTIPRAQPQQQVDGFVPEIARAALANPEVRRLACQMAVLLAAPQVEEEKVIEV